jgi:hypothetical protein
MMGAPSEVSPAAARAAYPGREAELINRNKFHLSNTLYLRMNYHFILHKNRNLTRTRLDAARELPDLPG